MPTFIICLFPESVGALAAVDASSATGILEERNSARGRKGSCWVFRSTVLHIRVGSCNPLTRDGGWIGSKGRGTHTSGFAEDAAAGQ